jgi:hypothetical protein
MKYKIQLTLIFTIFTILTLLPTTTYAFWFFNSTKSESPIIVLSDEEKEEAFIKYQLWIDSFDKKDIDKVISNSEKFTYTIPELNYILETESKNVKNPTITNTVIRNNNNILNITTDIHKIIKGNFSFNVNIISIDNKIKLEISKVKLYGISIPYKWLSDPVNKSLDEYFNFMYKDKRYQGFSFINKDNTIQIKLNFKK